MCPTIDKWSLRPPLILLLVNRAFMCLLKATHENNVCTLQTHFFQSLNRGRWLFCCIDTLCVNNSVHHTAHQLI